MKIHSTAPDGNDMAELEPARYFNLAKSTLNGMCEWMDGNDGPCQYMLVHIDILVVLAKQYPVVANLRIEEQDVTRWKETFYDWYERSNKKIPKKFREGIKESADGLFNELGNFGH